MVCLKCLPSLSQETGGNIELSSSVSNKHHTIDGESTVENVILLLLIALDALGVDHFDRLLVLDE